jgi:glucokinase
MPSSTRPPLPTVIGIDFGGTKIEVALASADGTLIERIRLDTRAEEGPDQALARACAAAQRLELHSLRHLGTAVGSYAAVAPGVIQPDRILLTPNLPGWEKLALARRLRLQLGVPAVAVANDVRAGALAEARFGALRDSDPGVYLSLGTGIAAAVTIGGEVLAGANQAAGEIGYLDPGPVPTDDARTPLEELIGGKALGERATTLLGEEVTAELLFARSDPAARGIVREALDLLATALANMAVLLDPQRIAIGGGMMAAADTILPALAAHLARVVPFPPQLTPAHFREDASLHGAVALAVDHLPVPASGVRPPTGPS